MKVSMDRRIGMFESHGSPNTSPQVLKRTCWPGSVALVFDADPEADLGKPETTVQVAARVQKQVE
jgi:hypothetical protein